MTSHAFALNLHSSASSVSDGNKVDRDFISSVFSDFSSLFDTSLANVTPFSRVQELDRKKRYSRAAAMLRTWANEKTDYDNKTWKTLEVELADNSVKLGSDES